MTQNLKIEVLTGDISIDGMVVTNLVTKEELSTAIVKKADLGTDGKIPTTQLPENILNTSTIVGEVKLQLETSIKDAVDESNAYAESYTDNALSSKADLTSGKVPLEQLPTIDQYPQFGTALSDLSSSILSSVKQRTDQLEKTKADLGEDGKVLREQIPSYEKISGLPEQLDVMSTQTAAVSGELDEHKLQTADQIDTLKENIEANVQQLTDRQSHLMRTYATKELGVDAKVGVKPGEYFYVRSTEEEEMLIEYQNVGGVATPSGKSYPSLEYVHAVKEAIINPTTGKADAEKVFDGNENQRQINRSTIRAVETIADLIAIQTPYKGQTVQVLDDLRGGKFEYKASRALENNGGTCFNGWVRKYFGSVYLDWFCETDTETTDCSLYMERALAVTRGVKCGGTDFLFTGRVGIPDVKDAYIGNEQSNYAERQINIRGDGDTTFHIDCATTGRPTFTSARAKANPTSTSDIFVGKVEFKEINFRGVNTTGSWTLDVANKNLVDTPFDGDRLYNSSAMFCNFVHLRSALRCMQNRGANVEGGNNYTQSFNLSLNHFYHCTYWAEADEFINFRCNRNQGERNYAGIKASNPNDVAAFAVCSFDYNLFESGGVFIDAVGDIRATSIWNNCFEHNIFGDMATYQSQINISGEVQGGVIGANNFGGQIDFVGYDTTYVDIRINGKVYDNNESNVSNMLHSKPVLIGNCTSSRQLITESRGLSIGNSTPYTTHNGWNNIATGEGWSNSKLLSLPFENDVAFTRGYFDLPFNYSTLDKNNVSRSIVNANNQMIVAILDLSQLEGGQAKNKMSTITGEVDVNLELKNVDVVSIANVSAKIHVGIYATARGSSISAQYNEVRVSAKLLSILQPYDIPLVNNNAVLMKKQFNESLTGIVVEELGGGKYALRLTNYTPTAVGAFGLPTSIISSLTWQASVGCEGIPSQVGAGVEFSNFWW